PNHPLIPDSLFSSKEKPKPSLTPQPSQPPIVALEDLFTFLNRHIQKLSNLQIKL
ncbi:hypothetical protein GIB67_010556, partial [Kingdonia uniflora]